MTGKRRDPGQGRDPEPDQSAVGLHLPPALPLSPTTAAASRIPPLIDGVACHAVHERRIDTPVAA